MKSFVIPEKPQPIPKELVLCQDLLSELPDSLKSVASETLSQIETKARDEAETFIYSLEKTHRLLMDEIEENIEGSVDYTFLDRAEIDNNTIDWQGFEWVKSLDNISGAKCTLSQLAKYKEGDAFYLDKGMFLAVSMVFKELEFKGWSPKLTISVHRFTIKSNVEITFHCSFVQ